MKKRIKYLILLIASIFSFALVGCSEEKTINEIYNVSYTGTITIEGLEDAIQAVIKNSKDAVVTVCNYTYSFGGIDLQGTGTAIIYEAKAVLTDGSIMDAKDTYTDATNVDHYQYKAITNQHVIADAYKVRVCFGEEEEEVSEEIYENKEKDLAIISFTSKYVLPTLEFGDSEDLKAGTFVVAIGSPNGIQYEDSASFGIISYVKRYIIEKSGIKKVTNEYIQTDCALSPGNSGGPLLDLSGKVIGINTMKISDTETEGMGFAIPSNVVKEFIKLYVEESTKE